jgi:hypothetical protein
VKIEQIRPDVIRKQSGGDVFYPTSGSPFVHLDTGSVRHWPRMTHDQLAKVFPDGRTVHLSSSGPLKGYELARADIERRGNGGETATVKMPNLFAALFKGGKSAEEDDEGTSAPVKNEKPAPTSAAAAKSADPVPTPRAKPAGATIQLAAADAQIVAAPKAKPESKPEAKPAQQAAADKGEPKLQTPADIINSRGFWDDVQKDPNQATPAQIAAFRARQALAAATDPQPTASVSESFNRAMAYAPAASSPVDRANIVSAAVPVPRSARPVRSSGTAATEINTVVAKGPQGSAQGQGQGQDAVVATATRLAAGRGNDIWMRVVMLAPSASTAMSTTVLGDTEMTQMRAYFVKPQAAIAMTFSEDPMMGMTSDRFTGSATAQLPTQSFVMRTAALR